MAGLEFGELADIDDEWRLGTTRRQVARVFERVDEVWARERTWSGLASGEGLIAAVAGENTDPRPSFPLGRGSWTMAPFHSRRSRVPRQIRAGVS
jgi:hypothetical protein